MNKRETVIPSTTKYKTVTFSQTIPNKSVVESIPPICIFLEMFFVWIDGCFRSILPTYCMKRLINSLETLIMNST